MNFEKELKNMKGSAGTLCLVIGDPVSHSLSPVMHTAGYKALGIDKEFAFGSISVKKDKLKEFLKAARALDVRGIAATVPHKEDIIPLLDEVETDAVTIGAVNTVLNRNGVLSGSNTDYVGVIEALRPKTSLKGKSAAVIGAGGGAKAAVFAFLNAGADVTVFNRSEEKAHALSLHLGCKAEPFSDLDKISDFDVVVNATSIGLTADFAASALSKINFKEGQIVMDMVYRPKETEFLRKAGAFGCIAVYGIDMLLHQGVKQFELYTGRAAPVEDMKEALYRGL